MVYGPQALVVAAKHFIIKYPFLNKVKVLIINIVIELNRTIRIINITGLSIVMMVQFLAYFLIK